MYYRFIGSDVYHEDKDCPKYIEEKNRYSMCARGQDEIFTDFLPCNCVKPKK
jgi:hypothetical protein